MKQFSMLMVGTGNLHDGVFLWRQECFVFSLVNYWGK